MLSTGETERLVSHLFPPMAWSQHDVIPPARASECHEDGYQLLARGCFPLPTPDSRLPTALNHSSSMMA
jgi:hypothetical protein